jgi:predicted alpha/beta-fold hydrolase
MLHPGYVEYQDIHMRLVRHLFFAIIYAALGSAVILIGGYTYMLDARPDLKVWHQTVLDAEYTADNDEVVDFEDYLQLEDRLFDQLREQVYDRIDPGDRRRVIRYSADSMMDPASFPKNWNRTFELAPDEPVGGILLLHGLSDSPYSMRSLGELLYQRGYHVVGLRIPGHGTAPSGLLDAQWEDWAAAVRIAAKHVADKAGPDRPLFVFGYSNGAALSVEYALASLEKDNLPVPNGLVLLSPAICKLAGQPRSIDRARQAGLELD